MLSTSPLATAAQMPVPGRPSPRQIADQLGYTSHWEWSWDNYKAMILELARQHGLKRHLEIGGGRDPLFQPPELKTYGIDVTINDISALELSLAPPEFSKVQCDIASEEAINILGREAYDFAYCRMVMEHVPDVQKMWTNVHDVLAPGGVALSFFPTLFAPPFVINELLPEKASKAILEYFFPDRKIEGDNPKFPAFYNHCRGSEEAIVPMLKAIGFKDVTVLPFYGYSYFWKIPVVKQVDAAFTKLAAARDWRTFTSFAYVIATK